MEMINEKVYYVLLRSQIDQNVTKYQIHNFVSFYIYYFEILIRVYVWFFINCMFNLSYPCVCVIFY